MSNEPVIIEHNPERGGSVLTTVVYFTLRSSLLAGRLDDTAVYVVSIVGGVLVIVGSSGLFLLASLYTSSSAGHTKSGYPVMKGFTPK